MSSNLAELIRNGGFVVLTGEFECSDRMMSMDIFAAAGLMVSSSVSRRTAFLLVGNNADHGKIDRAIELQVPAFSEEDFWTAIDIVFPAE